MRRSVTLSASRSLRHGIVLGAVLLAAVATLEPRALVARPLRQPRAGTWHATFGTHRRSAGTPAKPSTALRPALHVAAGAQPTAPARTPRTATPPAGVWARARPLATLTRTAPDTVHVLRPRASLVTACRPPPRHLAVRRLQTHPNAA